MSKLTHYIDFQLVTAKVDHELMAILFGRLHRRLWDLSCSTIGVSFPEYSLNPCTIGSRLRVHGTDSDIHQLMAQPWLRGFSHHVEISPILETPAVTTFARWMRGENAGNAAAKAGARERGEKYREASKLPHLWMGSRSTGQARYRLAIRRVDAPETAGTFNTFGLSTTATVPIF